MKKLIFKLFLFYLFINNIHAQHTQHISSLENIDKIDRFENLFSQLNSEQIQNFLNQNEISRSSKLEYKKIIGFEKKRNDSTITRVYWNKLSQKSINSLIGDMTFNQILDIYWPALEKFYKDNSVKLTREYNTYINDSLRSSEYINDNVALAFADNYNRTDWLNERFGRIGGFGIDISHHQGDIKWDKIYLDTIPERITMAIIKATDIGRNSKKPFLSKTYKTNWDWLKSNNKFLFGAYLFYQPELSTPETQANYFIKNVDLKAGYVRPIIDIESFPDCNNCDAKINFISNLKKLISLIENHYKTSVIIYTYDTFYLKYLKDKLDLKDRSLWLARYNSKGLFYRAKALTGKEPTLFDKSKVIGWQYTQEGTVSGIGKNNKCDKKTSVGCVDLNFIYDKSIVKWLIQENGN